MVSSINDPIEGTWLPFKAELGGAFAPDMALSKLQLVIAANTYAVHFGREITDEGSYTLGTGELFPTITLTGQQGVNAGRTIPSIYQLKGALLRICYGLDGTTPGAFAAGPGSNYYLVTYRRKG